MWALYCRVSKRDMHPENQRAALEAWAKAKGYQYTLFEEKESTRGGRPVKQTILAALRARTYEGVAIYKLDRWARSLQELLLELDELSTKAIEFVVVTQPIDTTSASGRLFVQILGAFAEFERELIRERTIAGLERARASGRVGGRPRKPLPMKRGEVLPSGAP